MPGFGGVGSTTSGPLVVGTGSGANSAQVSGAASGSAVSVGVASTSVDTNVALNLTSKGTGSISVQPSAKEVLRVTAGSDTGKYVEITRVSGTNSSSITAQGTQNLTLAASGGGVVSVASVLTCASTITGSSSITWSPGASVTPGTNGQVTVEFTSNTVLTFRAKGSDGTVRSATLTLA